MLQNVRLKHEKCLELDSVLKIVSEEAGFGDSVERILSLKPNYNFEDAINALKKRAMHMTLLLNSELREFRELKM